MKVSLLVKELEDNLRGVLNGGGQPLDTEITGIYYRSDRVKPGGLFVAVEGVKSDGHDFVGDAVSRGACAVVAQKPLDIGVPVVEVADSRYALARLASAFWGHPSRRMKLIGVTGTNGKTTTAFLLDHILQTAGFNTGVIGTVNYHYAGKTSRSGLTTPEAPDLQKILSEMAEAGVTHVILEVSSHGISLERIAGCRFAAGIFTNLSQDHLDFHGNMESYWAAKRRFFTDYIADFGKFAVINIDDKKGRELYSVLTGLRKISVGLNDAASVRASQLRFDQGGTSGRLYLEQGSFPFHSALAGRFNLENLMCASAAACELGAGMEAVCRGIETFVSVPGRMERISNTLDRHVFVDFSHTPAALKNVLVTLGEIVEGRLICIFGCGGDRDRGKRPEMGKTAAKYADLVVVTSDNPRTEDPEKIIEDIVSGIYGHRRICPASLSPDFESKVFTVEPDRRQAIRLGIRASKPGDAVLIAGKGHETYQIIGDKTIAFDDRVEAEQVLSWGMNDAAYTLDH